MAKRTRYLLEGHCYYTISVTKDRKPVFGHPEHADTLLGSIRFLREARLAYVLAYAILPDHLHLLFVPRGDATISRVMHSVKTYSAKSINRLNQRSGPIWQQNFYDRVIRSEEHLNRTIDYIHKNPVAAGFVERAEDYPYSSAHPRAETDQEGFFGD